MSRVRRHAARASVMGVCLLCAVGGGCTYSLQGPTTLSFRGLTESDARRVERELKAHELRVDRRRDGAVTTFTTSDIETTSELGEIYEAMHRLRTRERIEFEFEGVTLGYMSLTASGSTTTTAKIEVSPGAIAFVADGSEPNPWRQIQLDRNGVWRGDVQTAGRVSRSHGWLYVAYTTNGELYRFLKVNVLTGAQQQLTYTQARAAGISEPKPSRISSAQGTPSDDARSSDTKRVAGRDDEPKQRGTSKSTLTFKWPWQ